MSARVWSRPAAAVAVVLSLGCAAVSAADEEQATRRVSFRVESQREVANDWLRASLSVTDEDTDPAKLADRVNRTMAWALEQARGEKRVKVESGGYSTQPVYEDRRIRRWRATQQLWIEGRDFDAATALLGALQERLQLQFIHFSVSPERQRELEDELIEEALAAFQARAELVRKKLGASAYEIVRIDIGTSGGAPPPRPMMRMSAMAEAAVDVADPAVEGGSSRLGVGVDATIELD